MNEFRSVLLRLREWRQTVLRGTMLTAGILTLSFVVLFSPSPSPRTL